MMLAQDHIKVNKECRDSLIKYSTFGLMYSPPQRYTSFVDASFHSLPAIKAKTLKVGKY